MFKSRIFMCALVVVGCLAGDAIGMRWGGRGNAPVKDQNWRTGAVDLANFELRVAYWFGPTSQCEFLYRGNTDAFAEALRRFSLIRAPELELYIHDGPFEHWSLKGNANDPAANKNDARDARIDWSFIIHDAQEWYRWNNGIEGPRGRGTGAGAPLPAPRMDVWVGGGWIEWNQIRIPANLKVIDDRASTIGLDTREGSIIRGTVYDQATSKIMAGAAISVQVDKGGKRETIATAKSDAAGKFQFDKIPGGAYHVIVSADKYAPRTMAYAVLNGHDVQTYVAELAPEQTVSGKVLDANGKPVAGAQVRASMAMGMDGQGYGVQAPPVTTDEQGQFTIVGLPKGYCSLSFTAKGLHQIWDDNKPFSTSAKDIVLRGGWTGTIKGRVLDGDGSPLAKGNIYLQDAVGMKVGTWGGSKPLNPDGTFTFENVPVGKYVIAPKPIFLPGQPQPAEAKTITVEAGKTAEVELQLK